MSVNFKLFLCVGTKVFVFCRLVEPSRWFYRSLLKWSMNRNRLHYRMWPPLVSTQSGKTTTIRRIAVRETGIWQHHAAQFRDPLKPLAPSLHYRIQGVERGLLIGSPLCLETDFPVCYIDEYFMEIFFFCLMFWFWFFVGEEAVDDPMATGESSFEVRICNFYFLIFSSFFDVKNFLKILKIIFCLHFQLIYS